MAMTKTVDHSPVSIAEAQLERVAERGCAHHPHVRALLDGVSPHSGRDLADFVHLLCALHGRYPGMIELALQRCAAGSGYNWLQHASEGFERERLYLVRLTAAVGPTPSTPGAAATESTLMAARHALETLGMSERGGCALGAATALVSDWRPVRRLLDRAAARNGVEPPVPSLPDDALMVEAIDEAAATPAAARALAFGGEQMLLQHRGLFDLLEARCAARGDF
jgi:hypothetical protein